MRSTSIVLLHLTIVLLAVGCAPTETAAPPEKPAYTGAASVQGRLVYSDGQPVARVPVVLRNVYEETPDQNVMTDAEGKFVVDGITGGIYRLFEIRIYVDGGRGRCQVLERRYLRVDRARVDLGKLKLKRKTIMPVGG